MQNLADRLLRAIDEKQNPSVVGLDPTIEKIPEHIRISAFRCHGPGARAVAAAFVDFNTQIIDAVADTVPAVKPQIAFYEKYGSAGVEAFERTVAYAKSQGLMVIGDVKRNDIDTTAMAYAEGHLGCPAMLDGSGNGSGYHGMPVFDLDMITVNPYLGSDGVKPFLKICKELGKGIFVLDKTSNDSSVELQDLFVSTFSERRLYEVVAEMIHGWGGEFVGERGYSSIGAVVGAKSPEQAEKVRKLMPQAVLLVPGYGAQGGGAKDVVPCFNADGYGGIVNSSRGIIFAYLDKKYKDLYKPTEFHIAAKKAAEDMKQDIVGALREAGKLPKSWN